jgi:heptosyltransferase II
MTMRPSVLRNIDRYFGTLLYFLCWFISPIFGNGTKGKNIIVIKLWAIGESILVLSSIKSLASRGYNITVLCTKQNKFVFEHQSFINRVIVFDFMNPLKALACILSLRKSMFSIAIDSDPYMKFSSVLSVLSGAPRRYGLENRHLLYTDTVIINEDEHALLTFYKIFAAVDAFPAPQSLVPVFAAPVDMLLQEKSVAIHAGSASTSAMRRWSEENFSQLCDYFSSAGYGIYIVGSEDEKEICDRIANMCKNSVINLSGKLSLPQLAYLFSKMRLVVANDSGPMHIAASMGTPTIGLFGPNLPERFGPYGKNCIGIRKDNKPPCIRPFRARFPSCEHDHMKNIEVDDVIAAAKKLL